MKDNIDKKFSDFLSQKQVKTSDGFYEDLMSKINSQDELIEDNFDTFLDQKISTNVDFTLKLTKVKRRSFRFLKYSSCAAICLMGFAAYFYKDFNSQTNIVKTSDMEWYADAIFFTNDGLSDMSEVSSENALDMLNYFASTSL